MIVYKGQIVQFQSGDVTANGTVLDCHDACGLFVQSDRVVPIMLGRGSKYEQVTLGDRLWLRVSGHVIRDRDGCVIGFAVADDAVGEKTCNVSAI